jgi:hypothetical protein
MTRERFTFDSPVLALLGAGASVDAGIPDSTGLTKELVHALNGSLQRHWGVADAVNFAVGAIIGYDTSHGARPDAGIDVERLFSAIQMLSIRDDLEITPFVSTWHPAIASLGPEHQFPPFFTSAFRKALSSSSQSDLERLFKRAVAAQVGHRENIFPLVERELTFALRTRITVDPTRVDYLSPLLSLPGTPLQIVTLNYDRAFEEVCQRAGLTVDTGIEAWSGGFQWPWAGTEQTVRLLKLHGSIDWYQGRKERGTADPDLVVVASSEREMPVLVFGQRGKLRAEGPFLAMFRAFGDMLVNVRTLLVVGYSFRDEHVNVALRRWVAGDEKRTIIVIDPGFESNDYDFVKWLRRRYAPRHPDGTPIGNQRLTVFAKSAREGLVELLGAGPALTPVE